MYVLHEAIGIGIMYAQWKHHLYHTQLANMTIDKILDLSTQMFYAL